MLDIGKKNKMTIPPEFSEEIIASGYAKTREVDLAQELGVGKYIKKPYALAKDCCFRAFWRKVNDCSGSFQRILLVPG